MKIITKLITLSIISISMLSGCEKSNNDLASNSVSIDSESEDAEIMPELEMVSKTGFQKISQEYQTEYIRYESPYHGLYDENIKFPDTKYIKDYPPESYYNTVARYVMQKYPEADISKIFTRGEVDSVIFYNLLENNKYIYNYGAAFVYYVGDTIDWTLPYDAVVLYDPVNDRLLDLYTDELSMFFEQTIGDNINNETIFLSGFGQGKLQGDILLEMEPFLYTSPINGYYKTVDDQHKGSLNMRAYSRYSDSGQSNLNFVDKNTSFEEVLDFICAVSTDPENKTGNYYVDGGAAFYLLIDYKNNAEYNESIKTVTFSDGTKKSYTDTPDAELWQLDGAVEISRSQTQNDRVSALSLDYNEIDTPVFNETITKYVSFAERKQYAPSWNMPVFVFSPNTVEYEFIYSLQPKVGISPSSDFWNE